MRLIAVRDSSKAQGGRSIFLSKSLSREKKGSRSEYIFVHGLLVRGTCRHRKTKKHDDLGGSGENIEHRQGDGSGTVLRREGGRLAT